MTDDIFGGSSPKGNVVWVPWLSKRLNQLSEGTIWGELLTVVDRCTEDAEQELGDEDATVALLLSHQGSLLYTLSRHKEAEPLMRLALAIDEASYGPDHPDVAIDLNNLALLLQATNRLSEAEPLSRRHLLIFLACSKQGFEHPHLRAAISNYSGLLQAMGCSEDEITGKVQEIKASS